MAEVCAATGFEGRGGVPRAIIHPALLEDRLMPLQRLPLATGLLVAVLVGPLAGQLPEHKELKWFRDSREYVTLTHQIYRQATDAVRDAARRQSRGEPWAVVLDLDETTMDNSVYQLERAAYATVFDSASWNAWVRRAEAGAVPGVTEFIATVRAAGGRVAFLSGREVSLAEATRANLAALGLWRDGDLLCLRDAANTYTKRMRRTEIRSGAGPCAWAEPTAVLAYLGDSLGDFPDPDEEPGEFGVRFFLLPNPLYGTWERGVTR
jgi:acid phosphatase